MTNECTPVAGHFDGNVEVLKQYIQHRPMQHVQGYTRSHWTLPSGNYSPILLPRRPPWWQRTKQQCKINPLCWSFWWLWWCAGTTPYSSAKGGGSWLSQKPLKAAIGQALTPITYIGHAYPCFLWYISLSNFWKRPQSKSIAPNNTRGTTYQTDE